jgi:catechol 2,3-dioxygenase-like lactoylglutathione lyase family enzyme
LQIARAKSADILPAETYLGEKFTKAVPKEASKWKSVDGLSTPIEISRLDHSAIEVTDVELSVRFYTGVLGFKRLARPGFPFGGAWLNAGGLTLHLIERDPSVDMNDKYQQEGSSQNPEPWHIRRSEHKAFQVTDLAKAEQHLNDLGVEYHKFTVPGTNAAQIFLFDPDRNGVELGEGYAEIAAHLKDKEP